MEAQLRQLMTIFLKENESVNLSALRTPDACWAGNVLDSLAFMDVHPLLATERAVTTLLDIGTGGGFPLLPIALALPHLRCTGLDATRKKIDAIARMTDAMHLSNVTLVNERAETAGHDGTLRERFDVVTCRAVDTVATDLEYCASFCSVGGHIVLWKSMHVGNELAASAHAQEAVGCHLLRTHPYTLPDPLGTRQLLIFRKDRPTPRAYPSGTQQYLRDEASQRDAR
jgi:16S rRNA (guanine527-N7)-methyltransferase